MKLWLESGEEGEAKAIEGNTLTLLSPRAFAPGSPIRFSVVLDDRKRSFEGRTIGSMRVAEGSFEVRLRFVNLRRSERELLVSRLG
ncbi:MAG: hypothetical protein JSU89_08600 [Myxococcales bacterium]|nr:MAG: hypothetical protein JSU89_08600 [Myxococcales bacterium]